MAYEEPLDICILMAPHDLHAVPYDSFLVEVVCGATLKVEAAAAGAYIGFFGVKRPLGMVSS